MSNRPMKMFSLRILALAVLGTSTAFAQFQSGSTGTDGALNLVTPGTVIFDPTAMNLNAAGDNIFNFTTINIGPGVTVKLRASKLREKSVVWLATGTVTIAGILDLSGDDGYPSGSPSSLRSPAEPGPGGYAGGVGATDASPAQPGAGPGGGLTGYQATASPPYYTYAFPGCASHATSSSCFYGGGAIYGNSLLVPLRGGSGGAGSFKINGPGGSAGGGAIQIVSSVSINVTGSILANGGGGDGVDPHSASGSGGAIHIEAPSFTGGGTLRAIGGLTTSGAKAAGDGWIRVDAGTNNFSGTIQPAANFGPLFSAPLPSAVPTVTILTINGVAVPSAPTASFSAPDVTINSGTAVPVTLSAANIPIGTVLKLSVSSETGTDQIVSSTPLAGTVANSTASANIAWPLGVSKVYVRATW